MEAVPPLKTLLFDYVDERAVDDGMSRSPYAQFLRANVVTRLVNLTRRRQKDFELWKSMQGRNMKDDDEKIVGDALDSQDVAFFEWLCTGVYNFDAAQNEARTRLYAWTNATKTDIKRRKGKLFMQYLLEQRL